MKRFLLSLGMLLSAGVVFSQATNGTVEYKRVPLPAAVIELPYPPAVVEAAMSDYLSKKGKSKATDLKGFTSFRNTQALQNDTANADLYFKVERKSRQEKDISVLSLLLASPTESAATATSIHHFDIEQAKTYLNELAPAIGAYNLELRIKDQNDAVIKAESGYKTLLNDGADLEKKRADIEQKIADNKTRQEKQKAEVEKQRQALAALVNQRKA